MKARNLVSESFTWIFTVVSFFIYAKSVFEENILLSYLTVFVYIIPQLIVCIDDFTGKYLEAYMVNLSLIAIIISGVVVSGTLVLIAYKAPSPMFVRFILATISSIYIIRSTCHLGVGLYRYYKIHSNNNTNMEVSI